MKRITIITTLLVLSFLVSCSKNYIKGTDIPDTDENKAILKVFMQYVRAVKDRDSNVILNLASPSYYDSNGTSSAEDDVDYSALERFLSSEEYSKIIQVDPIIKVKDLAVNPDGDRAEIYYFFEIRAKKRTELPDERQSVFSKEGERWIKVSDDMLMILEKQNGRWLIVSGL